jgi:hypothetical protein
MFPRFPIFLLAMASLAAAPLPRIQVSPDGKHFTESGSGRTFVPWGFNHDHDAEGRLIEDYWHDEWPAVAGDFAEMKALGANVVRIHLQLGKVMRTAEQPDPKTLERLARLIDLAGETGLYLNLTGLGCYHAKDVPDWYDALPEKERWAVQARFWKAVAETAKGRPEIFCYDLMNEPIVPGGDKVETEWLAADFGGKHFVQRIALDPSGRKQVEIARDWVRHLSDSIRAVDRDTLLTVGVIPWATVFPNAKPLFHSAEAGKPLDFVSVHFYPERGKLDEALQALAVYEVGKPLVIEEIFPLKCGIDELETFIDRSRATADGWIGFYWGTPPEELATKVIGAAITRGWLEYFQTNAARMKAGGKRLEKPE